MTNYSIDYASKESPIDIGMANVMIKDDLKPYLYYRPTKDRPNQNFNLYHNDLKHDFVRYCLNSKHYFFL